MGIIINPGKALRITYLICLHLLVLLMLLKSNFIEKVANKLELSQAKVSQYYLSMIAYHQRMDGSVPAKANIFIGDSITQSLAVSAVAELSVNYGIGSDTTSGVLERLPLYKSINSANTVVMAIGINDLLRNDRDNIVKNYKRILDTLPQHTKIIVSAILPIDEGIASINLSNKIISTVNSQIDALAQNYSNVEYVNSKEFLQDSEGNLKGEYHIGDGIHLNTAGYEVWINQLKIALH